MSRVIGADALAAACASSDAAYDAALSASNARIGRIITAQARNRSPVRTGTLRGTIRPDGDDPTRTGGVAWGTVYGGVIHWGWRARGIAPQPFALDAAQNTRPQWERELDAASTQVLDGIGKAT